MIVQAPNHIIYVAMEFRRRKDIDIIKFHMICVTGLAGLT